LFWFKRGRVLFSNWVVPSAIAQFPASY